jgi:hypothetical protein
LKKLNVQPIQAIEEVNMFKSDGNVIHFSAPKGKFFHFWFGGPLKGLEGFTNFGFSGRLKPPSHRL